MPWRLFAASLQARQANCAATSIKEPYPGFSVTHVVAHTCTPILAQSKATAGEQALKLALEKFSVEDGWTGHDVFVVEIPTTMVVEATQAAQK